MKTFVLLFFLCCLTQSIAQDASQADSTSLENLFLRQLSLFPQEKIYIHTDKATYVTGEMMWMRVFLVDAVLLQQANASRYVYLELLNPLNSVVQRAMIRPDSLGHFYGQFLIDETLPEGDYTLRAYTRYMENLGDEYFFRRSIRIMDPLSAHLNSDISFSFEDKRARATVQFLDKKGQRVQPDDCMVILNDANIHAEGIRLTFDTDTLAYYTTKTKEATGILLLKAAYKGKKYHRFFQIPYDDNSFHVSFFPEGGQPLLETDMQIAFKALNKEGRSEHVKGIVYDNNGTEYTTFESEHLGMGSFRMYYKPGASYYAICTNQQNTSFRFELPPAVSDGYALKVIQGRNYMRVSVNGHKNSTPMPQLTLVAHIRGVVLYAKDWNHQRGYVTFDKDYFPTGVVHFLLLDAERNILSERLSFSLQKSSLAHVSITTYAGSYKAREKIELNVAVADENESPLPGNFSIAVVDSQDAIVDSVTNILSTLLLTSELKGYIESPMSYMKLDDRAATRALDVLMMTQGWRRYNLPEVLKGRFTHPSIPLETSQTITGKADGIFSAVKGGSISMIAMRDSVLGTSITTSDSKGLFTFENYEYPDSTWYIVQALTKKGAQRVFIEIDSVNTFPENNLMLPSRKHYEKDTRLSDYVEKSNNMYAIEHGMRVVNLAEVEVLASIVKEKEMSTSSPYYSVATSKVITAKEISESALMNTIFDVLRLLSGVTVSGSDVQYRRNTPLLILDNIPVEGYDYSNIFVGDVGDVFVTPAETVMPIFGSRAANGAIVINTKKGMVERNRLNNNIQVLKPIGYQQTVEFYSPRYETEVERQKTTSDLRTTIYWKPNVVIDHSGKATISFYAADVPTEYAVIIEGVSDFGHLIYSSDTTIKTR